MNKELVKESISQFEVAIDNLKQALLEKDKPKHKIGSWYKHTDGTILCVTSINDRGVLYGFGVDKKDCWFEHTDESSGKCACNDVAKDYTAEATPQEVEEALIREAKMRGIKDDCRLISIDGVDMVVNGVFVYKRNNLFFGGAVVFRDGKWAEVVDKFAELKEAHKNGAVIQFRNNLTGYEWIDCEWKPNWEAENEYRIKPKEKPKVGDVCKFWNDDEDAFIIGRHADSGYPSIHLGNESGYAFKNALPLNQQEVINLLFTDKQ